jgi:hypothetical protein
VLAAPDAAHGQCELLSNTFTLIGPPTIKVELSSMPMWVAWQRLPFPEARWEVPSLGRFPPNNNNSLIHIGPFQCSSVSSFVRDKPGLSHIGPYFADDDTVWRPITRYDEGDNQC